MNQILPETLVGSLVQGGAFVAAAAAPDNHKETLSNIEQIIQLCYLRVVFSGL